jgi:hypothetical protein
MQRSTRFGLLPIAALTLAASSIAFAPAANAAPAEACLSAPKGVAPQGSHWYYRIERPSQRKCWYLAEKGRRIAQRAAPKSAPQAQVDEEPDTDSAPTATAASAPAAPAASTPSVPAAEPQPVITTLVTRNVSNIEQMAQAPSVPDSTRPAATPSVSSSTMATEASPLAREQTASNPQAAPAVAEQAAPQLIATATDEKASAAGGPMPTLQLLLGAIALLGLLASVGLFVIAALRRRNDVLNRWRETAALPFEQSPDTAAEDSPAFGPMPASDIRQRDLEPMRQYDDVDEILHRLARRRRAA